MNILGIAIIICFFNNNSGSIAKKLHGSMMREWSARSTEISNL